MKKVHEIINVELPGKNFDGTKKGFPVAFIQWGHVEDGDGNEYEIICPYCAKPIGWSKPLGNLEFMKYEATKFMAEHWNKGCTNFGHTKFMVEKATEPLNTQHIPGVM